MAKKYNLAQYEKALQRAAEDAYKDEVIDTGMEYLMVGVGLEFANKTDWTEQRMEEWLEGG